MAKHRMPVVGDAVIVDGTPTKVAEVHPSGFMAEMVMVDSPNRPGYVRALTFKEFDDGHRSYWTNIVR